MSDGAFYVHAFIKAGVNYDSTLGLLRVFVKLGMISEYIFTTNTPSDTLISFKYIKIYRPKV